jgi:hypothetical protein
MNRKFSCLLILVAALTMQANAQFRLPPFEINVKGGFTSLLSKDYNTQMINVQGGVQVPINQFISVGWIYARTAYGNTRNNSSETSNKDYNTQELITGPEVRISTGRSRKLRPYLSLSYTKFQIVTDYEGYRNASKTNAMGIHAGLMLKLGGRMYLNLIEGGARKLADEPFWLTKGNIQIEIKTGLTYNFGKKK